MKFDFQTQLSAYDIPGSGSKYFYEMLKDRVVSPKDLSFQPYDESLEIYYAHMSINTKCILYYDPRDYWIIHTNKGINNYARIDDNYCEIGVRNTDGYYAKVTSNDGNSIYTYHVYYDNNAVDFVNTYKNYTSISDEINCNAFKKRGIVPDFSWYKESKYNKNDYNEMVLNEIRKMNDTNRIIDSVRSKMNIRRYR